MPGWATVGKIILLMLPVALAACTAPMEWEKPGVSKSTAATDQSDCHIIAQSQAMRIYPSYMSTYASGAAAMASQQHTDTDRAVAEAGYFESCMRDKGYVRRSAPPPPNR
ncbi:hypothetical protein SAMN02745126_05003 [Enhydrobacter aerosaccus]|uniref:Glycine zipper family protein n=1 Tax=Enhydrobacter aerosaccus TaxID=225324 RepID=A0A1T4SR67_9HYPH|nr:hypothetical protein [Enhydrobacter aerosaccus]SKA30646.1 hypothetical protein SAMN02745126_05003 [Enhydrobacter aerosaccus]